jgi:hypothetical protein
MRDMARPIKVLVANKEVSAELRRRANGRSTEHRDWFRAEIIRLRLVGMKIEDVAAHMNTSMDGLDLVVAVREGRARRPGGQRWPGP